MVAAANSISTSSAAAKAGANSGVDAKGSAADGSDEFTQLLGALLGNDQADTTAATQSGVAGAQAGQSKEDAKDDDIKDVPDVRQWLLMPQPAIPATPAMTPVTEQANDCVDALTPASNASANALLVQSLKRLGTTKNAQASSDTQVEGSAASALSSDASSTSLLDSMLKQPKEGFNQALAAVTDKGSNSSSNNDPATKLPDTLQMMANAQTNNTSSTTDTPAAQFQIHSRVGSHEWTRDVGDRLSMMVSNKVHSASLQLNPDNLGPVQVKIDVNDSQASVWFTADHPDTRTALEQSLPRLREMFASQGMSLMDAGVFSQQSQQQQSQFKSDPSYASQSGITDMSNEVTTTQQVLKIGLLDTYA
ncbi:MAG TPA: flagellar hook-length control protein FliK [Steroidobacteraceae bacterium]|nr:flagellar hook-length control protein FliK [Steroidobacteraceae bacterium]